MRFGKEQMCLRLRPRYADYLRDLSERKYRTPSAQVEAFLYEYATHQGERSQLEGKEEKHNDE